MTRPPQCDATHEGIRCALDKGHQPRHAATTPTSLARWNSGADAEVTTWRRQSQPPVFKADPTCPACGKKTTPRNYREKFCSDDCRKASRRETNRKNKINVRRRSRQRDTAA